MKKSYRIAQEALYIAALKVVGVKPSRITAHRDASATVPSNEAANAKIAAIKGVEVVAKGATEITFRIPAAVEYHNANAPLITPEEKAKLAAEKEARKAERASKASGTVEVEVEDFDTEETEG